MSRILSIEDSADIQQLLGMALQARGYEVHYAFNGKEGYEKVLSLDPDLVLLDLMIPVMNGVEVIRRMKAEPETRDIPILIVSAYGDEADLLSTALKALGALDYIRKPFDIQHLASRIESILGRSKPKRATPPSPELRKGTVRLNVKFRTVWVENRLVATLPHRLHALLRALLEAPGGVHREALLKALWPDGTATPNALQKLVERLRKSLGPHGRLLQTLPDGYELVEMPPADNR